MLLVLLVLLFGGFFKINVLEGFLPTLICYLVSISASFSFMSPSATLWTIQYHERNANTLTRSAVLHVLVIIKLHESKHTIFFRIIYFNFAQG